MFSSPNLHLVRKCGAGNDFSVEESQTFLRDMSPSLSTPTLRYTLAVYTAATTNDGFHLLPSLNEYVGCIQ